MSDEIIIGNYKYIKTPFGLKQLDYKKIDYNENYIKNNASKSNVKICLIRLLFLLNVIEENEFKNFNVLELGPGNGQFFNFIKSYVNTIDGYDEAPTKYSTINPFMIKKKYDVLFAFDVIEHMDDINQIWNINFDIGYFSIPCPPKNGVSEQWKHFRPNEHIWHITYEQFKLWIESNGYTLLLHGSPEDDVRVRWDKNEININSFIIKRYVK